MSTEDIRLAVVDPERCKVKKCSKSCRSVCPINRAGKDCVRVTEKGCQIYESLCIGCGMCVKKCEFHAIQVINLPRALEEETSHRYGKNGFKLHRLPYPRPKQVLGLVGQNGIGKSTALQILSKKLTPNLGITAQKKQPTMKDVIQKFRGSELQSYLTRLESEPDYRVAMKPQMVDNLAKIAKAKLGDVLKQKDQTGQLNKVVAQLQLQNLLNRDLTQLSGGELQRFAIALICLQKANAFFFDEPTSYLDVGQRMQAARIIRDCLENGDYVIAIEHDLAIIDYMSDYVSILYGQPGAYGVISAPFSCREGINHFLEGFIPTENMRFRDEALIFRISDDDQMVEADKNVFKYPGMSLTLGEFHLEVESGGFRNGELVVLLGQNGVGKTTFVRLLSGNQEPDSVTAEPLKLSISYKPQKINPHFDGTVQQLLEAKIPSSLTQPLYKEMVLNQLNLDLIKDNKVKKLSGGELQRVAIALALGKNADLYLIDEPSAFLDAEQRVIISKIIKRYIMNTGKAAFVVEHDFIMATYLASKVLVFDGTPGVSTIARAPQGLVQGMNYFLKQMSVTLRSDKETKRPRVNKYNSNKDKSQKSEGKYFVLE